MTGTSPPMGDDVPTMDNTPTTTHFTEADEVLLMPKLRAERTARLVGLLLAGLALVTAAFASWVVYAVHSERVHSQREIDRLACLIVAPYPADIAPVIRDARAYYDCPPFDPRVLDLYPHPQQRQ